MKSAVNIDMNGHEVQNIKINPVYELPQDLTEADAGKVFTDMNDDKIKLWNGTEFVSAGSNVDMSVTGTILNIVIS